jgi:hypothetical protein
MQCRQFLGAAAALSALSVGAPSTATADSGGGDESDREEDFFTLPNNAKCNECIQMLPGGVC